jgi:hypothetical protein
MEWHVSNRAGSTVRDKQGKSRGCGVLDMCYLRLDFLT